MASGKTSAGLLMYRRTARGLEVFLVHPGGPFHRNKDLGHWGIPKGEYEPGEDPGEVACREFEEETGRDVAACAVMAGERIALGSIRQKSGKVVTAWAFEGDWPDGLEPRSNRFTIEWPPSSGRSAEFPEVDRAGFFTLEEARAKILAAQGELIERLVATLGQRGQ
jgi:predicted NUDIX family NTP pyrophosphohydrolase